MFTILTLYVNFLCSFLCFDKIYFSIVNYTYYVFRTKVKVFGSSNLQYTDAHQRAIHCSSYYVSAIYVKKNNTLYNSVAIQYRDIAIFGQIFHVENIKINKPIVVEKIIFFQPFISIVSETERFRKRGGEIGQPYTERRESYHLVCTTKDRRRRGGDNTIKRYKWDADHARLRSVDRPRYILAVRYKTHGRCT